MKQYFHIGVAVDTENGLVVPVIRDADRKGLFELAAELEDLSTRARSRRLRPADLQGGSFSISSLGGIGGTFFTPIVNHPEVAILGVSRMAVAAGLAGRRLRAAPAAAALALLRPPRDRRRRRGALHAAPRRAARRPAPAAALAVARAPSSSACRTSASSSDVDVVEVLVAAGDRVEAGQALIVIESEKASMEIPSPAGRRGGVARGRA